MRFFILLILGSMLTAEVVVDASTIKTKILEGPDSDGDVVVVVSVVVENKGRESEYTIFELQGLDADGFEMEDIILSLTVPPGQRKIATDKTYMNLRRYKSIVIWQKE